MSLPITYSAAEVAASLGRSAEWLVESAARRPDLYPSLKVGKYVRFTQAQVDTIVARCTRSAPAATTPQLTSLGRPVRNRAPRPARRSA